MEIEIKIIGQIDADPKSRIMAVEATARAICERFGLDPAEATMMLLTAAAHTARTYAKRDADISIVLAEALGCAVVAADDFFKLRLRPS